MIDEVIRTSGDVRRLIADTMQEVRAGRMEIGKANAIAALAKELSASMQTEINVVKVNLQLRKDGVAINQISHMGKMIIGDDSTPTLNGSADHGNNK